MIERAILHPFQILLAALFVLALLAKDASAQVVLPEQPLADASAEARARKLMGEIRCVVCQAQSIAESDAPIAADMRRLVRELVAKGSEDAAIRAHLTQRYGDFVLFKPPFKGTTMLLWFGPFLLLAAGAGVIFVFFRANSRAGKPAGLSGEEAARLRGVLSATEAPDAASDNNRGRS